MIKVKIDQPGQNTFYVEEGYTVSYADDVLEVLNEDDETIAVFRGWLYAMPADEVEEELEEDSPVLTLGDVDLADVFQLEPESASLAHAQNHGSGAVPGDETEGPAL